MKTVRQQINLDRVSDQLDRLLEVITNAWADDDTRERETLAIKQAVANMRAKGKLK